MELNEALYIVESSLPKKYPCLLWDAWEIVKKKALLEESSGIAKQCPFIKHATPLKDGRDAEIQHTSRCNCLS